MVYILYPACKTRGPPEAHPPFALVPAAHSQVE